MHPLPNICRFPSPQSHDNFLMILSGYWLLGKIRKQFGNCLFRCRTSFQLLLSIKWILHYHASSCFCAGCSLSFEKAKSDKKFKILWLPDLSKKLNISWYYRRINIFRLSFKLNGSSTWLEAFFIPNSVSAGRMSRYSNKKSH